MCDKIKNKNNMNIKNNEIGKRNKKNRKCQIGSLQKKILILLAGGLSIALSQNPRKQFQILKQMEREWEKVRKDSLKRAIRSLYESKLINIKENADGTVEMLINKKGKQILLKYKLDEIKIKTPKKWDGKWRIIIFDIPEKMKEARNAFRFHLKKLGFYSFQKSAFILPYHCEEEIEFLIEFYNLKQYVRQIVAEHIDNELHLKKIFGLKE